MAALSPQGSARHNNASPQLTQHSQPSYESAVFALNSLQSNASVIQKIRQQRALHPEKNLIDMAQYLDQVGVTSAHLNSLKVIHVSGTKGKGSTCAFVESILRRRGLKTGFYSSPHLVHVRERIRINGEPLSEDEFTRYFWTVFERVEKAAITQEIGMPAYFKFLTILAYYVFTRENLDVAIVEVGIGGAFDCTNVLRAPTVCGVTLLDLDHMGMLGSSLEEIAWHKAGIFKRHVPAVTVPQPADALAVLRRRADEIQCPLYMAPPFSAYNWPTTRLKVGIAGKHQYWNITLAMQLVRLFLRATERTAEAEADALTVADELAETAPLPILTGFAVTPTHLKGIRECCWPGRSQVLRAGRVTFFLDGAHTPKSLQCCAEWFASESRRQASRSGDKPIRVLLFHCTADRNPESLLPLLADCRFDCALFSPTLTRSAIDMHSDQANKNQNQLSQLDKCELNRKVWTRLGDGDGVRRRRASSSGSALTEVLPSIDDALDWVRRCPDWLGVAADSPVSVLVTGSLHLVGGVLSIVDSDLSASSGT